MTCSVTAALALDAQGAASTSEVYQGHALDGTPADQPETNAQHDSTPAAQDTAGQGFVSYGLHGGTRAVEYLRLALAEVKIACVRTQVAGLRFALLMLLSHPAQEMASAIPEQLPGREDLPLEETTSQP